MDLLDHSIYVNLVQCLGFILNMMKQRLATKLPAAGTNFKRISDVSVPKVVRFKSKLKTHG